MSEMAALGELRADFTERNTALFLFLGLVSGFEGLLRTLEAEAERPARPPVAPETPPASPPVFDYFVLGLIAFGGQVMTLAEHGRQDASPSEPPRLSSLPAGLLR
jgi:hypothetical protein